MRKRMTMTKREARAWARVHDLETKVMGSIVEKMKALLDKYLETDEITFIPEQCRLSFDLERVWQCIKKQVIDPDNPIHPSMILVRRKDNHKVKQYMDIAFYRGNKAEWEPVDGVEPAPYRVKGETVK
jgi:hypothetical protein